MPTIRPFRDISEHEVINLFRYASGTLDKGSFVKLESGFLADRSNLDIGIPAGASFGMPRDWEAGPARWRQGHSW